MTKHPSAIPYTQFASLSALDLEEVKEFVARKDLAYSSLEESVTEFAQECERRLQAAVAERDEIRAERDGLKSKNSQLEILLRGRQAALISKEQECVGLRERVASIDLQKRSDQNNSFRVSVGVGSFLLRPHEVGEKVRADVVERSTMTISSCVDGRVTGGVKPKPPSPWLSVVSGLATFFIPPNCSSKPANGLTQFSFSTHLVHPTSPLVPMTRNSSTRSVVVSPPTVYHRRVTTPSSDDSDDDPTGFSPRNHRFARRSLNTTAKSASSGPIAFRDSFASLRTSFGTVRSSRTTVRSVSSGDEGDSSDASLDKLVSHAMRLSSGSRVSTGSSVVRGSVVRNSGESGTSSAFPKRWK